MLPSKSQCAFVKVNCLLCTNLTQNLYKKSKINQITNLQVYQSQFLPNSSCQDWTSNHGLCTTYMYIKLSQRIQLKGDRIKGHRPFEPQTMLFVIGSSWQSERNANAYSLSRALLKTQGCVPDRSGQPRGQVLDIQLY